LSVHEEFSPLSAQGLTVTPIEQMGSQRIDVVGVDAVKANQPAGRHHPPSTGANEDQVFGVRLNLLQKTIDLRDRAFPPMSCGVCMDMPVEATGAAGMPQVLHKAK